MRSTKGASASGPSEQLMPTACAPRLESTTAAISGVVPRNVRPSSPNVMVAKTGRLVASRAASTAALRLEQVGHGLDEDEVGAVALGGHGLLAEERVRLFERQRAERLQERARGADVGRHVASAGRARAGDGGGEDLVDAGRVPQLAGVGAERVRRDDLGARLHVRAVDGGDLVGNAAGSAAPAARRPRARAPGAWCPWRRRTRGAPCPRARRASGRPSRRVRPTDRSYRVRPWHTTPLFLISQVARSWQAAHGDAWPACGGDGVEEPYNGGDAFRGQQQVRRQHGQAPTAHRRAARARWRAAPRAAGRRSPG